MLYAYAFYTHTQVPADFFRDEIAKANFLGPSLATLMQVGRIFILYSYIHSCKKKTYIANSLGNSLAVVIQVERMYTYRFIRVIYVCMRLQFLGPSLANLNQVDRI